MTNLAILVQELLGLNLNPMKTALRISNEWSRPESEFSALMSNFFM